MLTVFFLALFLVRLNWLHAADATEGGGAGLPKAHCKTQPVTHSGLVAFVISVWHHRHWRNADLGREISEFVMSHYLCKSRLSASSFLAKSLLSGTMFSGAVIPQGESVGC